MTEIPLPLEPERHVTPRFKVGNFGPCACGCGMEAVYRRKAWVDGLHCRGCVCRRCVGSRQAPKARRREHKVAKAIGGARQPMSGNLSGYDVGSGLWRIEETANVALVRGFRRWVESKQVTVKTARLMALTGVRHAFVVSWDGRAQYAIVPFADFAEQCQDDLGEAS